mmetsp:Transcript_10000/g.19757  ORF Transcript_10000/g.19757 Transcript_10000/m.19757 type:complete len:203 (-) Transcript_10000:1193-1801(-)
MVAGHHLHVDQGCADVFDRLHRGFTGWIFDRQDACHHHLHVWTFVVHVHTHSKRLVAALAKVLVNLLGVRSNVLVVEHSPLDITSVVGIVAVEDFGEEAFGDFQVFRESCVSVFVARHCAEGALDVGVEAVVHVSFGAVAFVAVVDSRHGHLHLRKSLEDRALDLIFLGVFERGAQRGELHDIFPAEILREAFHRLVHPYLG